MSAAPSFRVPAVTGGFIYVGLANSREVVGELGGTLLKIELASGSIVSKFTWSIPENERDAHGFCGMGCTPSVVGDDKTGKVYFVGFNAKLYCLECRRPVAGLGHRPAQPRPRAKSADTDLRPEADPTETPPAAGWSAPLVVNGRVYLGIGEGENPNMNSFVFCLDAAVGQRRVDLLHQPVCIGPTQSAQPAPAPCAERRRCRLRRSPSFAEPVR